MSLRIINKSKEGVTIKTPNGNVKLDWKNFNSMYVIVNDFYVEPNEETKKKFEEVDQLCMQAYVIQKTVDTAKTKNKYDVNIVSDLARIYSISEKIQALMGFPNMFDTIKFLKERFGMYEGVLKTPFNAFYKIKKSIRKQEIEEKRKAENKEEYNEIRSFNTLGDVKGFDKLKEMFKE